jgi:hypothetical protein
MSDDTLGTMTPCERCGAPTQPTGTTRPSEPITGIGDSPVEILLEREYECTGCHRRVWVPTGDRA